MGEMRTTIKGFLVLLTLVLGLAAATPAFALPNPAAAYAEKLGYECRAVKTAQGTRTVVVVEPDIEFDAWDFYKGKAGEEYSYGARHGCAQCGGGGS